MLTPTKELPHVLISNGLITVTRGLEAHDTQSITFVGCYDGPLVQIRAAGDKTTGLLISVELAKELIEALKLVVVEPVCAPGAHDADLAATGFEALPR